MKRPWATVEPLALAAEAAGRFDEARDLYASADCAEARLGLARCLLALGEHDRAIAAARAAPPCVDAVLVEANAHARAGRHAEVLAVLSDLPDDGAAHFARGKALLALKRLGDARDAFDKALAQSASPAAALHLRREADRAMTELRRVVGSSVVTAPPDEAVALVTKGFVDAAIELLRKRGDSPLLLAGCLAHAKRPAEALAIFDAHGAHTGAGYALLDLDRTSDALARFDAALATRPGDSSMRSMAAPAPSLVSVASRRPSWPSDVCLSSRSDEATPGAGAEAPSRDALHDHSGRLRPIVGTWWEPRRHAWSRDALRIP